MPADHDGDRVFRGGGQGVYRWHFLRHYLGCSVIGRDRFPG
jgi:hypothetical protein